MFNLSYDASADTLYVYVSDAVPVLQQWADSADSEYRILVDLDESGQVRGIAIARPGDPWNPGPLLDTYSPSFSLAFAEWLLRIADEHDVWARLRQ